MKAVAAYCRVSTNDQTTENQRLAIDTYCKSKGITNVKFYEDTISGASTERPSLKHLKADIADGKIEAVIVWKLDRLARSTIHLLQTLNFFRVNKLPFISVTENVDTETPAGQMLLTLLGAIAQFEREIIRERVNSGLNRAKANGIKLGRPRKGFDVATALDLRNQGKGFGEIAEILGECKSTVYRSLKRVSKTS